MDAKKALEITITNWVNNEDKYLKYVIGYQDKVEKAAEEGKTSCAVGVVPIEHSHFVTGFYEKLGFYVLYQQVSPTDFVVTLDWHLYPTSSRNFLDNNKFINSLALDNS